MGRLYKVKVDEIQKLSKEGHLQKEIAERLGVNVRTVRKYAPSSRSTSSGSNPTGSVLESIRNVIAFILDHIEVMENHMELDKVRNGRCPRCSEKQFELDPIKLVYRCGNCGHRLVLPSDVCRNCFAQNNYDEDTDQDPYKCKECGHEMNY
ncbi:MAG: response regulator transcription factor [Deltaproteobacteria bacterium]|nr:response regulator transcription factor [Deltaproteobacteria bacterium]